MEKGFNVMAWDQRRWACDRRQTSRLSQLKCKPLFDEAFRPRSRTGRLRYMIHVRDSCPSRELSKREPLQQQASGRGNCRFGDRAERLSKAFGPVTGQQRQSPIRCHGPVTITDYRWKTGSGQIDADVDLLRILQKRTKATFLSRQKTDYP